MTTDATVIVPTFRRPASVARLIGSLARQRPSGVSWELIVIDNDDPPGAEAAVHAASDRFPTSIRYVREPRRGTAHARNRGIAEASGGIVAMVDDDVIVSDDWLERLLEPILAGRCEGAGGRINLDPAVPRPGWFDEAGIGGYLASFHLGDEERELAHGEIVFTANAAFRTDILRETGGFNPALGPKGTLQLAGEDNLIVREFRARGGRIRWVPGALVIHELPGTRLSPRYLLRRAYLQGRSDWMLDRELLSERRLNGARVAGSWLAGQLRRRRREGVLRPAVAFHAATDVARTLGALREAASWMLRPGTGR